MAKGHGGKRPGSGRKKGAVTKKTQEIAAKASAEGITPLEVMVGAMREAWERNDRDAAARYAKDAAPYMHPRLAAIEHTGVDGKDLIPSVPAKDVARAIFDIFREARGAPE
jgi:hypothetical protein